MLEFEVAGDRNNFIDLQKVFLEIKCKIVQGSGTDLKYDAGAAADVTKTDAPYFCNTVLHSLFSDCTVSANGLKISIAKGNCANKSSNETQTILYKYDCDCVPVIENKLGVVRAYNYLADLWGLPRSPESPPPTPGCVSTPTSDPSATVTAESSPSLFSPLQRRNLHGISAQYQLQVSCC